MTKPLQIAHHFAPADDDRTRQQIAAATEASRRVAAVYEAACRVLADAQRAGATGDARAPT